jgi:hypothetical protein
MLCICGIINAMTKKATTSKTLPRFLKRYLGEVKFEKVRLPERECYVVERLLEYGDDQAIHWLKETFALETIGRVVRESRAISHRTANLWGLFLGIPHGEIRRFTEPQLIDFPSF